MEWRNDARVTQPPRDMARHVIGGRGLGERAGVVCFGILVEILIIYLRRSMDIKPENTKVTE